MKKLLTLSLVSALLVSGAYAAESKTETQSQESQDFAQLVKKAEEQQKVDVEDYSKRLTADLNTTLANLTATTQTKEKNPLNIKWTKYVAEHTSANNSAAEEQDTNGSRDFFFASQYFYQLLGGRVLTGSKTENNVKTPVYEDLATLAPKAAQAFAKLRAGDAREAGVARLFLKSFVEYQTALTTAGATQATATDAQRQAAVAAVAADVQDADLKAGLQEFFAKVVYPSTTAGEAGAAAYLNTRILTDGLDRLEAQGVLKQTTNADENLTKPYTWTENLTEADKVALQNGTRALLDLVHDSYAYYLSVYGPGLAAARGYLQLQGLETSSHLGELALAQDALEFSRGLETDGLFARLQYQFFGGETYQAHRPLLNLGYRHSLDEQTHFTPYFYGSYGEAKAEAVGYDKAFDFGAGVVVDYSHNDFFLQAGGYLDYHKRNLVQGEFDRGDRSVVSFGGAVKADYLVYNDNGFQVRPGLLLQGLFRPAGADFQSAIKSQVSVSTQTNNVETSKVSYEDQRAVFTLKDYGSAAVVAALALHSEYKHDNLMLGLDLTAGHSWHFFTRPELAFKETALNGCAPAGVVTTTCQAKYNVLSLVDGKTVNDVNSAWRATGNLNLAYKLQPGHTVFANAGAQYEVGQGVSANVGVGYKVEF